MTFSVSAAKPTTSAGRSVLRAATVARMSGFSTSASAGVPPAPLLHLFGRRVGDAPVGDGGGEDRDIGRQRGLDRRQHLARAISTWTVATPAGSASVTGPETSVTRAPAAAAAAAMAWPCLPEERLAI